jgi:protein-disulfide isomerase
MKSKPLITRYFVLVILSTVASHVAFGQTTRRGDDVAAVVNGKIVISQEQVDAAVGAPLLALQEKLYNLRQSALENLVTEAVLKEEAAKRGLNVSDLKKTLMPGEVKVEQTEIDAIYLESRDALANMGEDEAKQRIRLDLESRKKLDQYKRAVSAILTESSVERRLASPQPPQWLTRATGPSRGGSNAPVTVVEFSDFECPYCKDSAHELKHLLADYGAKIALVYKHMPLPIHANAYKAARASVCAAEQDKFWEYHDRLFASNDLADEALKRYASDLGLQSEKFNDCLTADTSAAVVRKDMAEARQAGVRGTPTLFVNGRIVSGSKGLTEVRRAIDDALKHDAGVAGAATLKLVESPNHSNSR